MSKDKDSTASLELKYSEKISKIQKGLLEEVKFVIAGMRMNKITPTLKDGVIELVGGDRETFNKMSEIGLYKISMEKKAIKVELLEDTQQNIDNRKKLIIMLLNTELAAEVAAVNQLKVTKDMSDEEESDLKAKKESHKQAFIRISKAISEIKINNKY